MVKKSIVCPCGSRKNLIDCCYPYISGKEKPDTAENLMRSRYTAYVLKDSEYILKTWHPSSRPKNFDLSREVIIWKNLEILNCEKGRVSDTEGDVFFKASYEHDSKKYCIQELSRFVKENGIWLYLIGEQSKTIIIT
jgi:SEC-C motif domain protein